MCLVAGSSLSTEITGWQWMGLTNSTAWNLQLGSRLQWLGPSNRLIIFNDHNCQHSTLETSRRLLMSQDVQEAFEANSVAAEKRYMRSMHAAASSAQPGSKADPDAQQQHQSEVCSVVYDIQTRQRLHTLPRSVYSVSPDGKQAVSFDLHRLDVVQAGESPHSYGRVQYMSHLGVQSPAPVWSRWCCSTGCVLQVVTALVFAWRCSFLLCDRSSADGASDCMICQLPMQPDIMHTVQSACSDTHMHSIKPCTLLQDLDMAACTQLSV